MPTAITLSPDSSFFRNVCFCASEPYSASTRIGPKLPACTTSALRGEAADRDDAFAPHDQRIDLRLEQRPPGDQRKPGERRHRARQRLHIAARQVAVAANGCKAFDFLDHPHCLVGTDRSQLNDEILV